MQRLIGKNALITGGSSGIGLATAKLFQNEGAQVVITGVDRPSLDRGLSELAPGTLGYVMRAERVNEIRDMFKELAAKNWLFDILIPSAGIAPPSDLLDADEALFDQVFDVNVKGVFFTVQYAVPLLRRGASVVLLCSATHALGRKGRTFYSASKAAIRSFVRSFAAELLDLDIRVNAISPGPVMTPLHHFANDDLHAYQNRLAAMIPMQRLATLAEIAGTILFLVLPESAYMTGSEVAVDGGWGQGVFR